MSFCDFWLCCCGYTEYQHQPPPPSPSPQQPQRQTQIVNVAQQQAPPPVQQQPPQLPPQVPAPALPPAPMGYYYMPPRQAAPWPYGVPASAKSSYDDPPPPVMGQPAARTTPVRPVDRAPSTSPAGAAPGVGTGNNNASVTVSIAVHAQHHPGRIMSSVPPRRVPSDHHDSPPAPVTGQKPTYHDESPSAQVTAQHPAAQAPWPARQSSRATSAVHDLSLQSSTQMAPPSRVPSMKAHDPPPPVPRVPSQRRPPQTPWPARQPSKTHQTPPPTSMNPPLSQPEQPPHVPSKSYYYDTPAWTEALPRADSMAHRAPDYHQHGASERLMKLSE